MPLPISSRFVPASRARSAASRSTVAISDTSNPRRRERRSDHGRSGPPTPSLGADRASSPPTIGPPR
eukprot:12880490-Prorocentrum_lima.AAC.1